MIEGEKIHINFTGASGTGKTTLLDALREALPEYEFNTEVVRTLLKEQGIKINEMGDEDGQKLIFNTYMDFLLRGKGKTYVSDRCIIDPLAYTMLHVNSHQIDRKLLDDQWNAVKLAVRSHYIDYVFYFPIEFANESDGVRSDSDEFRNETDAAIRAILSDLKREFPYFRVIEVRGTVEQRKNIILNFIKNNKGNE